MAVFNFCISKQLSSRRVLDASRHDASILMMCLDKARAGMFN